jgi:hypothetical protein
MSSAAPVQCALSPTGASVLAILVNVGWVAGGNATRAQKLAQSVSTAFGQQGHFAR